MNHSIYRYYVSTCIPIEGSSQEGITCEVINSNGKAHSYIISKHEFNIIAAAYQDIIDKNQMLSLIDTHHNGSDTHYLPKYDRDLDNLVKMGLIACGEGNTRQEAIDNLARDVFFCPITLSTVMGVPASRKLLLKAFSNSVRSIFLPTQLRKIYSYISESPGNTLSRYFEKNVNSDKITEGIAAYILLVKGYIIPCGYQVS